MSEDSAERVRIQYFLQMKDSMVLDGEKVWKRSNITNNMLKTEQLVFHKTVNHILDLTEQCQSYSWEIQNFKWYPLNYERLWNLSCD